MDTTGIRETDRSSYPTTERRMETRKKAKFTLKYHVVGLKDVPEHVTTTENVSFQSVFFESNELITFGTTLHLELIIPSMLEPLEAEGEVVRITEIERGKRYAYAAIFTKISHENQQNLQKYVELPDIEALMRYAVNEGASDIHLVADQPPIFRMSGELVVLALPPISPEDLRPMILNILTDKQKANFNENLELDFSYYIPEGVRFRVNIHRERGHVEAAFRIIPSEVQTISELGLPSVLEELAQRRKGLILVTGPTGAGKTTTLASMIDVINKNRNAMIISIEDPIEYVHKSVKSIIKQREVGTDTLSFSNALKHALRQDPDVIFVGEIRDLESVSMAITAAETGHLVLTTLHTPDTIEAINRVIDVYPPGQQSQIRSQLSGCLQGIVSQVLLPKKDGQGRILATEVLVGTPAIKNLIREGKIGQITSYLESGAQYGMRSLDNSLLDLVKKGRVEEDIAKGYAKNMTLFDKQPVGVQ